MVVHSSSPVKMLLPRIVVLLAVSILVSLGCWQYKRWEFKNQLIESQANLSHQHPLSNAQLINNASSIENFSPAKVTGKALEQHSLLLDNQIYNGVAGADVLVPIMLDDNTALYVNRGFVTQPLNRKKLPEYQPMQLSEFYSGQLRRYKKPPFTKTAIEKETAEFPKRIQFFDNALIQSYTGYTVLPWVLELDASHAGTITPKKPLQEWLSPERHLGYSLQWFGLAICLIIIYFAVERNRGSHANNS